MKNVINKQEIAEELRQLIDEIIQSENSTETLRIGKRIKLRLNILLAEKKDDDLTPGFEDDDLNPIQEF